MTIVHRPRQIHHLPNYLSWHPDPIPSEDTESDPQPTDDDFPWPINNARNEPGFFENFPEPLPPAVAPTLPVAPVIPNTSVEAPNTIPLSLDNFQAQ